MTLRRPTVRRACTLLLLPWVALLLASCLLLLWYALTPTGHAIGLGLGLLAAGAFLILPLGRPRHPLHLASLALGLALLAWAVAAAPPGRGGDTTLELAHVFPEPGDRFARFSPFNVLPEADLVGLGIGLARWVDPFIDGPQAARIREQTRRIYAELDNDPAFAGIGSVISLAWAEQRGAAFDSGHYLALLPRKRRGKLPAVVFLHGSGGNFACLWYALSPLARRHGLAVICPSFGCGNWQRPGGVEAIERAVRDACRRFPLDPRRLTLVALSNGGRGATRAIAAHPGLFAGVVLASPVLEHEPLRDGARAWRGRRVLWFHGAQDRRIPLRATQERIASIELAGASVTRRVFAAEDHFVFFERRAEILHAIAAWIAER